MALRVNDNSNQLFSLRQTQVNHSEISKRLSRIASGLRINQASDDVAASAVAESLSAQGRGLDVAGRNIQDFTSLAQTADAGLGEIQDMTQRINELSVQAANGTLSSEDRLNIQNEISQFTQEIDRQAGSVQFNGQPLLTGTFSSSAQAGPNSSDTINLTLSAVNSSTLGLSGIDVTSQSGAQSAIGVAQGAVNSIATERAGIGATVNRLQSASDFTGNARENAAAAESRIRDADVAEELLGLTTAQVREQTGLFSLAQGNIDRRNAVRLLGS